MVVKHTAHDASFEAEGLAALRAAGARVPEVFEVGDHHLVMEDLADTAARRPNRDDWATLGRMLATVHRVTGDAFGWGRDNVIGTTAQRNDPRADWPIFYWDLRIAPHLDVVPAALAERLRSARAELHRRLDHDVVPSLVHGDLWSGNVLGGRVLIDPAVCHADRELDLAFARVFGGFPAPFFAAYDEAWPRDDGWQEREPLLQLYHLLVHVRLFGSSYVPSVAARLDAAGL